MCSSDLAVLKDGLVRADTLPLVFKTMGCEALPRNTRVRVRITGMDLLTLDLHARLAHRLDDAAPGASGDQGSDASDAGEAGDEDDLQSAAPLTLAIDLGESDSAAALPAAADTAS